MVSNDPDITLNVGTVFGSNFISRAFVTRADLVMYACNLSTKTCYTGENRGVHWTDLSRVGMSRACAIASLASICFCKMSYWRWYYHQRICSCGGSIMFSDTTLAGFVVAGPCCLRDNTRLNDVEFVHQCSWALHGYARSCTYWSKY